MIIKTMKMTLGVLIIGVLTITLMVITVTNTFRLEKDCKNKGGVLVKSLMEMTCVSKASLIEINK